VVVVGDVSAGAPSRRPETGTWRRPEGLLDPGELVAAPPVVTRLDIGAR
jgi:hypothetical protein